MALALIIMIPNAYAQSTQMVVAPFANQTIDASEEDVGQRLVRAYVEFTNFDIDTQNHFNVDLIQVETGKVVTSSIVKVYSDENGLIHFGSLVGFIVPVNSIAGNYQIQISTINGIMATPHQFSVI